MEPCPGCEAAVRGDQSALLRREESQRGKRRVKDTGNLKLKIVSGAMQNDLNLKATMQYETDVKFNFVKSDRVPDL